MRRKTLLAVAMLATAGLAACEQRDGPVAVRGICPDWKTAAAAAADPSGPTDNCVKRWAYSLAGTREDAAAVADAVVAACDSSLARWNTTNLAAGPEGAEAISITTGQPTNPMQEHYGFAQSRALLYVIQARAGRCAAPEVKDGVPVGIAP